MFLSKPISSDRGATCRKKKKFANDAWLRWRHCVSGTDDNVEQALEMLGRDPHSLEELAKVIRKLRREKLRADLLNQNPYNY